jgi:hypothetical protein
MNLMLVAKGCNGVIASGGNKVGGPICSRNPKNIVAK